MIGVDYELFWTLNPKSLSPFVKAFDLKKQYDDSICWRTGFYVLMAIGNVFGKNIKYPTNPLEMKADGKHDNGVMDAEVIKAKMMKTMVVHNSRFRKEEDGNG